MIRFALLRVTVVGMTMGVGLGCSSPAPSAEQRAEPPSKVVERKVDASALAPATGSASSVAAAAPSVAARITASALLPAAAEKATGPSSIQVKRLVVTTGVKEREPLGGDEPLIANGTAIYAFAELSNPGDSSENVRITFERKGGAERVGNVVLPVPGQVARHRTWATTRFIRAAGVWEAVLWSESGVELGRTSFEVAPS